MSLEKQPYNPSDEEMKKAEETMTEKQAVLSEEREKMVNVLGTGVDTDHLYIKNLDDDTPMAFGELFGKEIKISRSSTGKIDCTIDGKVIEEYHDREALWNKIQDIYRKNYDVIKYEVRENEEVLEAQADLNEYGVNDTIDKILSLKN